jgi:CHAD domain-containing protein
VNSLQTYYRNLYKEYHLYLRDIIRKADARSIHKLRIIIKKIRAVFHLLASADSDFDFEQHFNPFNNIFKASGKIRDFDITIKRISKLDVNHRKSRVKNITEVLPRERAAKVTDMKVIAKKNLAAEKSCDEIADQLMEKGIERKDLEYFLSQTLSEVKSESKKHISEERLHGIRKLYKEYLYNSKGAGNDAREYSEKKYQHVDHTQKQIGDWHDYVIACDIIKNLSKKGTGVDKILKVMQKEKKRLKKLIVDGGLALNL